MSRRSVCHALILRATDIGEADRFCILLTRERGRLAARAPGVRKTGSRMAGSLLPLSFVSAELLESSSGTRIVGVRTLGIDAPGHRDVRGFLRAQQGIEFLLKLLQDDEPMPEVFALAAEFLTLCSTAQSSPVMPFGLRLLGLLGLLPLSAEHAGFRSLPAEQQAFVRRCATKDDLAVLCEEAAEDRLLEGFLYGALDELVASPLRARNVANAM